MIELSSHSKWSPEEDAILRACYSRAGAAWGGWGTLLPNRSTLAIRNRANYIGLHYDGPTKVPDHGDLERVDEGAAIAVAALSNEQRETLKLLVMSANARGKVA